MIKVGYNYQIFTQQRYGGISRIFSQIAPLIDSSDDFEVDIYAGLHENQYLADDLITDIKGKFISYPPKGTKLFLAINSIFAKVALEVYKPDIVHETFYSNINTVPGKSKTVITVLDMIHEKFPIGSNDFLEIKARAIRRADSVICISNHTKKDLIEILDINPAKISVVHLGHAISDNLPSVTPVLCEPYLLYVGMRIPGYKNFERLLRAYASNKIIKDNFKLVCFGPKPFSRYEIGLIQDLKIDTNVLYYSGNDALLANFYIHAESFIYPSLYEGFGIPPLEAMSFNCPVVCSNLSSIPEVIGDAGEYFDPYDIDSISEAIQKVVFSSTLKQDLRIRGKERIKLFSWEKCATETELVYKEMMGT